MYFISLGKHAGITGSSFIEIYEHESDKSIQATLTFIGKKTNSHKERENILTAVAKTKEYFSQ